MAGGPVVIAKTLAFVSHEKAHKKPTHHQFVRGLGYVHHGCEPDLPSGARGSKNCAPPEGTKDGTVHLLQPPGSAPPMKMVWIAAEKAWKSQIAGRGNRLAWTPAHLSRAGWSYVGSGRRR